MADHERKYAAMVSTEMIIDVFACFEMCWVDTPVLRGIKTYGKAITWRDADYDNRFVIGFAVDHDPEVIPPRDLFEWAKQNTQEQSA